MQRVHGGGSATNGLVAHTVTIEEMINDLIAFVDMDHPPWTYSDALRERRKILERLCRLRQAFAESVGESVVDE